MFACEWNPISVTALRHNLDQMGMSDKCTVLQGDNRIVCPKNVADRVNLGLIPESTISWKTAAEALKNKGGILYVHGNVECGKDENKKLIFSEWASGVCDSFSKLLKDVNGKDYIVDVLHIECVKSYAPRIFHVVADIKCGEL